MDKFNNKYSKLTLVEFIKEIMKLESSTNNEIMFRGILYENDFSGYSEDRLIEIISKLRSFNPTEKCLISKIQTLLKSTREALPEL